MFCTRCGVALDLGANFCVGCGQQIPPDSPAPHLSHPTTAPSIPVEASTDWPTNFKFPRLTAEKYIPSCVFDKAMIKRNFFPRSQYFEPQPTESYEVPKVLVTNRRIIFLDFNPVTKTYESFVRKVTFKRKMEDIPGQSEKGLVWQRPVDSPHGSFASRIPNTIELGWFWVLKQEANEELHQEFKKNPTAYSQARGIPWVRGYREWDWVTNISAPDENSDSLTFTLMSVVAVDRWGPGRGFSTRKDTNSVQLILSEPAEAAALHDVIRVSVGAELGSPFSEQYLASQPLKPLAGGMLAYYYAFWVGIPLLFLAFFLRSRSFPLGISLPILGVVGYAIVSYLRRRIKRAAERNKD
jgi:hypothetical protein